MINVISIKLDFVLTSGADDFNFHFENLLISSGTLLVEMKIIFYAAQHSVVKMMSLQVYYYLYFITSHSVYNTTIANCKYTFNGIQKCA